MARLVMLSTKDNPYNPFTNWEEWYQWDIFHHHNSSEKLGRIALTSPALSDAEYSNEMEKAIDFLIANDYEQKYIKVEKVFPDEDFNDES